MVRSARIEALERQERLCGAGCTLPEICLLLRAAVNGSADEWPPARVAEAVAMLRDRLLTWQSADSRSARVDAAVRELVEATVAEVDGYGWWQSGTTSG